MRSEERRLADRAGLPALTRSQSPAVHISSHMHLKRCPMAPSALLSFASSIQLATGNKGSGPDEEAGQWFTGSADYQSSTSAPVET
jgi:hypothetical protein